ncbi:gtcR [Symbiodinium sp. CCMP2592]|nr:gtcR [Symbiodinium sp. CCMP2592]
MKSQDLGDVEDEDDSSNRALEMPTAARVSSMSQKGSHENQKSGTRRRKKTPSDPASREPETAERHFTALSNKAASDSSLATETMSNAFSAEADYAPTILCVDDDPVHLEVVRSLLTQHALKVYAVADGDQAVQFLKMRSVQLMLLDVMMPGMSGQRVLRSVRKFYTPEQLPIIIVSAVCRQETMSECAKLGANDYVMKPFGRAELLEHVQLHLSKATQARVSRKARELKGIEELASSSTSTAMEEPQTAVHVLAKEMERIRSDRDEAVERAQALQKQVEALEAELQNKKDTLLSEEQLKFLQTSQTRQQVLRQHHETMAAQIQRLELLQKSQHKLLSARANQDLDGLLQIASLGPGQGSQPPLADPKLLQIRKVEDDVGYYLTSIEQLATRLPASSKEELQRLAYQLRAETNKLLLEMGLKCHELGSADSMLQHQWLQLQRDLGSTELKLSCESAALDRA